MKIIALMSIVIGAGCLFVAGCDKKSDTVLTPSGQGFELAKISDTSIKQADSESVKVSIDRKGGFEGPVTVEISGLPPGVTVDGGATHTILAKESSVSLKLLASDRAAPSEKNAITVKAFGPVDGQNLSKQDVFNLKVVSRS